MSDIRDFFICDSDLLFYDGPGGDVVIPEGVTEIGNGAFSGRSDITSIFIPTGVEKIGKCAFEICSGLTRVVIPDGAKKIGEGAFRWCSALKEVVIPDSVEPIIVKSYKNRCKSRALVKKNKHDGFESQPSCSYGCRDRT